MITLSKTDYILYRECPKNVWFKIHKPDIYSESELSDFEKTIIETGNEVELEVRKLFLGGILIEGRDVGAQNATNDYIANKQPILFQPIFVKNNFLAAVDILQFDPGTGGYSVYEVKSTNEIDDKAHYHDLAFQVNLLRSCGLKIEKAYLIHLNSEYVRSGALDIEKLFKIVDVTSEVEGLCGDVSNESKTALEYLSQEAEPNGLCCCVYKGRSRHCPTFHHSNPEVPEYGVHDIARIGNSKAKLQELVDKSIFHLHEIPDHIKLSEIQKNQIDAHVSDKTSVKNAEISQELSSLVYPLYFLDYETFPCAIPRFDGFSPYQQIPFQYSLHILKSPSGTPSHKEFLFTGSDDPSQSFVESLKRDIGNSGSIIVWNKKFECKINEQLGERITNTKSFIDSVNLRVYDLMDIFSKQYYVHKGFRGSTSIKAILPTLAPDLSYSDLEIQEGGTAADKWNKMVLGLVAKDEGHKIAENLRLYCGRDTNAMYVIWRHLYELVK